MQTAEPRARWPRIVLTLPPEASAELLELARANLRDPKREALRLLLEGLRLQKERNVR